jgi:hypothetical protein
MLQRLLIITLTLCSLTASAQWQQTGAKVRYVNGLGIPTKDTAAGVAADSSQIVIRPADSSLYVKYKRTWIRVGGGAGGGSIGGSGTINRVPKFTAGTTIGNSSIVDSASAVAMTINASGKVGIGTSSPWENLSIPFNSKLSFGDSEYPLSISRSGAGYLITTISDNYDVDNTRIDFVMRNGSANQNTPLSILSTGNVGIGYTAPVAKLAVNGTTLINTNTDNGVDKLQVSGSVTATGTVTAATIVKSGGTSSQALMANGSVLTLISGSYVPSLSNISNTSNLSVLDSCTYERVGNIVTVYFQVLGNCTASALNSFRIGIPVGGAFTTTTQCIGSAMSTGSTSQAAYINSEVSANAVVNFYTVAGLTGFTYYGSFQYKVK